MPQKRKEQKNKSKYKVTARDKSPLQRQNNIAPAQSSLVVLALALFAALGLDDYVYARGIRTRNPEGRLLPQSNPHSGG